MTVPDYQSLMLPLLEFVQDRKEHRVPDVADALAKRLRLSDSDLAEMLPSGRQTLLYNRAHWAKTYLAQARLLEITRRGYFKITDRGLDVLRQKPESLNVKFLEQFEEFRDFKIRAKQSQEGGSSETTVSPSAHGLPQNSAILATPDELLRETVSSIETVLARELLERILTAPPVFFENLIVTLLVRMGYGGSREEAGRAIGRSGDGGIDGVIDQDPLGLDRVYVQAKRYAVENGVSEPEIRGFSGSLGAEKGNKGVFVTTSYFTKPAYQFAERHPFKMVLIDGAQLASLMIRHNVGVRVSETFEIKKLDEEFFVDE
jgi:restriction system protein